MGWKNTSNVPDCIRFATWNIGTVSGRSAEVVETLHRRMIDVCCVQETRWTGSGARVMVSACQGINSSGRVVKMVMQELGYSYFIVISDRWIDRIVDVKRVSERIMCLKMLIGDKLVT